MSFDIVLTDPFVVDSNSKVFKLWLDCISKDHAVERLLADYLKASNWTELANQHVDHLRKLFDSDTTDQYRMFGLLERYLKEPLRLRTQHVCYLDSQTKRVLIHNYYSLDNTSIHELIKYYRDHKRQGKRSKRSKTTYFSSVSSPLDRHLYSEWHNK